MLRATTTLFALLFVCIAAAAAAASAPRPQWPQRPYVIQWHWRMAYPSGNAAEGLMTYRGNGTAVYYYIHALRLNQLQVGGTVWNWHEGNASGCYSWHVPYDLNTAWFDNATMAYEQPSPSNASLLEHTWVGALVTPHSPLGVPFVSYVATTVGDDPVPTRYVPVGILRPMGAMPHERGSEVLVRLNVSYAEQDAAYFVLPSECSEP